ncbi:MAG: hypothetical protein NXI32_25520 [bacterium]|nr:hypothetical protein [bacterium]
MSPDIEPVVITVMVVALIAAYPGWLMYQKAFYTSQGWFRLLTALFCLLLPPVIAGICFFIPFQVLRGSQSTAQSLFTDFVTYAILPAGVLALLGWVADFIADRDRPRRAMFGGAALFAIVLLPAAYYLYADQAADQFEIQVQAESVEP